MDDKVIKFTRPPAKAYVPAGGDLAAAHQQIARLACLVLLKHVFEASADPQGVAEDMDRTARSHADWLLLDDRLREFVAAELRELLGMALGPAEGHRFCRRMEEGD